MVARIDQAGIERDLAPGIEIAMEVADGDDPLRRLDRLRGQRRQRRQGYQDQAEQPADCSDQVPFSLAKPRYPSRPANAWSSPGGPIVALLNPICNLGRFTPTTLSV